MIEPHLWLAFASACFVVGVIPGSGVASILGFAFSSGRRTALAGVAGMAVGNTVAMTVSLLGAGAILATSAWAFTALKWVGAAYLIVIGTLAIARSGRVGDVSATPRRAVSPRAAFMTNIAVGTFHPKTILFFVAFAAPFIRPDRPFLPQAALLIATFTAIAATTDTLYALAASRASGWLSDPRARVWTQRAGGGAVIGAGVAMAALQR